MGESLWNWWNMVRNSHVLDVERTILSFAVFSRIVSAGHPRSSRIGGANTARHSGHETILGCLYIELY